MTRQEVRERYQIPELVLNEYESWGFGRAQSYDDEDLQRLSLLLTLLDIGFSAQEAEVYIRLLLDGPAREKARLQMLEAQRRKLLDEIHSREKQLARLDYLRHEVQKQLRGV